jgi:hypothetical protein
MKATIPWLGAVLCAAIAGSLAQAQFCAPALRTPILPAPDACGPGCYYTNPYGMTYGPNYNVRPPFPPVNGMPPQAGFGQQGGGVGMFPSHPFARGPRDFFMWNEVLEERILRERRPALVP